MVVPPAFITQRPPVPSQIAEIARDFDFDLFGFPIVNFREGKAWLLDGQNRIAALKQLGFKDEDLVDCECYDGLSDEDMARLFLGRDARTAIGSFVKFFISCTAGKTRENAIRRVVELNGAKIRRASEDNCVSCVSVLCKIYDTSKDRDTAVGWVIRVARSAFSGDPLGFEAHVLEALGLVNNRYNCTADSKLKEKDLIAKLAAIPKGARGLLVRSEALRERTGQGKSHCLAAVIVDIYNKNLMGRSRLASWWKEAGKELKSA